MDKAKKTSLSLPDSLREIAQLRANNRFRGNFSGYVQSLIEKDEQASVPADYDPKIIELLCRVYAGYLSPGLSESLAERAVDQPRLLHQILSTMLEELACGSDWKNLVVASNHRVVKSSAEEIQKSIYDAATKLKAGAPLKKSNFMQKEPADLVLNESAIPPPHTVAPVETEHARAALHKAKVAPTPPPPTPVGAV